MLLAGVAGERFSKDVIGDGGGLKWYSCLIFFISLHRLDREHLPSLDSDELALHSADVVSSVGIHPTLHAAVAEDGKDAGREIAGSEAALAFLAGILDGIPDETSSVAVGYLGSPDYHVAACYEACVAERGVALEKSSVAWVHSGILPTVAAPSCGLPFAVH